MDHYRWIHIINDLVKTCNSKMHRTTKIKPKDVDILLKTTFPRKEIILKGLQWVNIKFVIQCV